MYDISKSQRRTYRDQDPPRIRDRSTENLLKEDFVSSKSTPNSPTALQRASSLEKCFSDPDFFKKQNQLKRDESSCQAEVATGPSSREDSTSSSWENNASSELSGENACVSKNSEVVSKEFLGKVSSSSRIPREVVTNGVKNDLDSCNGLSNGKEMAPVLGGPPPPPPAPHMGPDGLILPRKPYNPYMVSGKHKDLHRELLFNQKVGKNVLNQKSELQRALDRHREAVSRKEAEKHREEYYKNDPRTALQRAIEQRAKHIQLTEESQHTEAPNPLVTARAKLRTRVDSQ
ncbi:uncharacterized protein LOC107273825 [Cephus cinctus]|uniref:Uncharacterized protein LOC107273825 n=1 Tax=Cephus cinctus TaxID=211228 RepID=A0AAJ7CD86_CEPCN|nr:uncharacterized protein LOC107273825 [Cephus cinctus]XP_015607857.1 uncharacterized protein LOC107273825 [Cephus cinctus]XP_024946935.1 uncharacterized protein LOC107273825 [Cephus cinctus]